MTVTLEIYSPQGRRAAVELDGRPATVGRPAPDHEPDVPLDDPRRWVSRQHCVLEAKGKTWYLTDHGTENGTFLRRDDRTERVTGRVRLHEGDLIWIPGDRTEDGRLLYWQLGLIWHDELDDSHGTEPARPQPLGGCVEYDFAQARLFHYMDGQRVEIDLTGNEHRLIHYMADRNHQAGGVAVACRKDELLRAVWGDAEGGIPFGIDEQNLRDLVGGLRKKLEADPMHIVQTVTDIGYRLWTCARSSASPQE